MKRNLIVFSIALAGLLVFSGLLDSQTDNQSAEELIWPPSPEDLINVVGEEKFGKGQSTREIYKVPEKTWLLVTDFRRIHTGPLDPELDLMMVKHGARKPLMVLPYRMSETSFSSHFGSSVGLKFPPQSTVVLRRNERSSSTQTSQYLLVGYLVAE